jgi:hypothetical protein
MGLANLKLTNYFLFFRATANLIIYTSCTFKVVRVIFGTKENLYFLEDQLLLKNNFIEGKKYQYRRGGGAT